jgi:hypothetical protein
VRFSSAMGMSVSTVVRLAAGNGFPSVESQCKILFINK